MSIVKDGKTSIETECPGCQHRFGQEYDIDWHDHADFEDEVTCPSCGLDFPVDVSVDISVDIEEGEYAEE